MREQGFKEKTRGRHVRPFSRLAKVRCRGDSRRLERILVDFGADPSFGGAVEKLKEHDGIEVPARACRDATLRHAAEIRQHWAVSPLLPAEEGEGVEVLISQSDGTLVPLVTVKPGKGDRRKLRAVCWKEAISALAYAKGSVTPVYAATLAGRDEAGFLMKQVALEAGLGSRTRVHALGDGASWMDEKVQFHFGAQATFLIDFYH